LLGCRLVISEYRRPLLGYGSVNTSTDTHATIEVLLEKMFYTVVRAEELNEDKWGNLYERL
jgi:hypothetical protein